MQRALKARAGARNQTRVRSRKVKSRLWLWVILLDLNAAARSLFPTQLYGVNRRYLLGLDLERDKYRHFIFLCPTQHGIEAYS